MVLIYMLIDGVTYYPRSWPQVRLKRGISVNHVSPGLWYTRPGLFRWLRKSRQTSSDQLCISQWRDLWIHTIGLYDVKWELIMPLPFQWMGAAFQYPYTDWTDSCYCLRFGVTRLSGRRLRCRDTRIHGFQMRLRGLQDLWLHRGPQGRFPMDACKREHSN
jgi:hypothetical protein